MYIVFSEEDANKLKESFELDSSFGSEVIVLDDDFSVGPLRDEGENGVNRNEWIANMILKPVEETQEDEIKIISDYLDEHPEENALMWIGPNSRDVSGYYFMVSNLKKFGQRISAIWLNNLPFINEKGQIFYPKYLHEIPAKEFLKAKKLAQPISASTYETDPDEWQKAISENKMVRLLEGAKKLVGKDAGVFDSELISQLNFVWQKSGRIVQGVQSKLKYTISDSFLYWRLRELIKENRLEAQGDWVSGERFDVRKSGGAPAGENESQLNG